MKPTALLAFRLVAAVATAPAEGDADLVVGVSGEAGIAEGMIRVPDLHLLDHRPTGDVELDDLDMRMREVEPARPAVAVAGGPAEPEFVQAPGNADHRVVRKPVLTPRLTPPPNQLLPFGPLELSVPFGQLRTSTSRQK